MTSAGTLALLIVGALLLFSAVAKASLNPVTWLLYWLRTRRRLAVLGVAIVLLIAAHSFTGQRRVAGLPDSTTRDGPLVYGCAVATGMSTRADAPRVRRDRCSATRNEGGIREP